MPRELLYRRVSWKYVLEEDVYLTLPGKLFGLTSTYTSPYLVVKAPQLCIRSGYAWDGASGPTVDTTATMYPALVHDALYQLIRLGVLPVARREAVDKLFRQLLKKDGMTFFRRWYFYQAVRWFGASSARPE